MAELLVRVIDKINDDFYKNCQCTKRGDVIAVKPDGWLWSSEELRNPDWRIIKTSSTVEECKSFLKSQEDGKLITDVTKSKTLLKRAVKLNIDDTIISTVLKTSISDNSRSIKIDFQLIDINSIKIVKDFVVDPNIKGVNV